MFFLGGGWSLDLGFCMCGEGDDRKKNCQCDKVLPYRVIHVTTINMVTMVHEMKYLLFKLLLKHNKKISMVSKKNQHGIQE